MRKLRLDERGLSPLVAVIVLLTLVMVLGAIIAGTLSGAPRPVLPAITAINITTPHGGNPAAGDNVLVIRHEYGQQIANAWEPRPLISEHWKKEKVYHSWDMKLLINGEEALPLVNHATEHGALVWDALGQTPIGAPSRLDFAVGDRIEVELYEPLESSDLIQLVYAPRDLMLVEYLVQ